LRVRVRWTRGLPSVPALPNFAPPRRSGAAARGYNAIPDRIAVSGDRAPRDEDRRPARDHAERQSAEADRADRKAPDRRAQREGAEGAPPECPAARGAASPSEDH